MGLVYPRYAEPVTRHSSSSHTLHNSLRMELRQELADVVREIHAHGWSQGTGGNYGVLLSRDTLRILMTPSGIDKGKVAPEALIEVDANGEAVAGGTPSAETL